MVKKISLLLVVLMLAVATAVGQTSDAQAWQTYTVEERDFSVSMPTLPVLTINRTIFQGETRGEEILKASAGGILYRVDIFENRNGEQKLKEFIKDLTQTGWDLGTERSVTVNGVEGKEYLTQSKQTVAQFFSTKRHLYRFATSGAVATDPRVNQFFSSISFDKKTAGIKVKSDGKPLYYRDDLGEVFTGKNVERKVRLLSKPEPSYPQKAVENGARGRVTLVAAFAATGQVVNIRVLYSNTGDVLVHAAIEAARKIRFEPAMKDGKPVSMWMQLEYNFML